MTEKFSTAMYMDRGAEQLVEILNHYISAIVESKCPHGFLIYVCFISCFPVFFGYNLVECDLCFPHEMCEKPVFFEI